MGPRHLNAPPHAEGDQAVAENAAPPQALEGVLLLVHYRLGYGRERGHGRIHVRLCALRVVYCDTEPRRVGLLRGERPVRGPVGEQQRGLREADQ